MEVKLAIIASATSLLMFGMRTWLIWRLGNKALETGADVEFGGLNPLAPKVAIRPGSRPPGDIVRTDQTGLGSVSAAPTAQYEEDVKCPKIDSRGKSSVPGLASMKP